MKEKNMSQKYDWKIWEKKLRIKNVLKMWLRECELKMWLQKKYEQKNVSIKNVIVKKCFSKKIIK